MNKALIILLASGLVACGENEGIVFESAEGKACTSEATTGGVNIVCPDGTTFIKNGLDGANGIDGINGLNGVDGKDGANGLNGANGKDGKNGTNGKNGKDGKNGINGTNGKDGVNGTNGLDGKNGTDGKDGIDGTNGTDGKDGADGKSCKVVATKTGAKLVCEDGTEVEITNGKDGTDGTNGIDGKDGKNGTNGLNGKDGTDGKDGVILSTTLAPVAGVCHNIGPGIWAKNEGMKADVYDNSNCSHQGSVGTYSDNGAICNNVSDLNEHSEDQNGENCWTDNKTKVEVKGTYSDMVFQVLTYN